MSNNLKTIIKSVIVATLGVISLFITMAGLASITPNNTATKSPVTIKDMLIPVAKPKPRTLGAGGAITLTNAGTIRYLKAFFYSNVGCSTMLGVASITDDSDGFPFTNGQTVALNSSSTYQLANNLGIATGNIACMKLYWDGNAESSDGADCQSFSNEACSGTSCSSSTTGTATWEASPAICNNNTNSRAYMYINVNGSNDADVCTVDASAGTISGCTQATTPLSNPYGAVANNGYVYFAEYNDKIEKCKINSTDGTLSGCASTATGITNNPRGMTINTKFAYVGSDSNNVWKCDVSSSNGNLTNCATTFTVGSGNVSDVTINKGFSYISDFGGSGEIFKCTVNASTGVFSSCTTPVTGLTNPFEVAVNNDYLYVTSGSSVSYYSIDASGNLTSLGTTGTGFDAPWGITFFNGKAYVSNTGAGSDTISMCTVNSNGTLTGCVDASSGAFTFSDPTGMAIYQ